MAEQKRSMRVVVVFPNQPWLALDVIQLRITDTTGNEEVLETNRAQPLGIAFEKYAQIKGVARHRSPLLFSC
jgi:hypothetical protein